MHSYPLVPNLTSSVTHTQQMLKVCGYISAAEILHGGYIPMQFNSSFKLLIFRSDKAYINFKTYIIHYSVVFRRIRLECQASHMTTSGLKI